MRHLVSIGLPVCNGGEYLERSIESLLAQEYRNIEIIVVDNASIDESLSILRKLSQKDNRIKVFSTKNRVAATDNFNNAFLQASGEFFKWHTHDDILDKTYIKKCVNVLNNNPNAVLCSTDTLIINRKGEIERVHENIDSKGLDLNSRLRSVYERSFWSEICGVIRANALKNSRLFQNFSCSDVILLCELALQGEFERICEPLYVYQNKERKLDEYITYLGIDNKGIPPYTIMVRKIYELFLIIPCSVEQRKEIVNEFIRILCTKNSYVRNMILQENLLGIIKNIITDSKFGCEKN